MVYLYSISCLRYTIQVGNPRSDLQLLSQCGSTYTCLSRSVPEIHLRVAGTLNNQPTTTAYHVDLQDLSTFYHFTTPSSSLVLSGLSIPYIMLHAFRHFTLFLLYKPQAFSVCYLRVNVHNIISQNTDKSLATNRPSIPTL